MVARTEVCYVIARTEGYTGLAFRITRMEPRLRRNEFAVKLAIKLPDSFWGRVYRQEIELTGNGDLKPEITFQVRDARGCFRSTHAPKEMPIG